MGAFQVRPGPLYRFTKPVRDALYRRFIKSFPCLACLSTWRVDPCHTGPHGTSQKACDLTCIPLCRKCHQEFDANPYEFAEKHGLDIPARIAWFNEQYRLKIRKEAA